MIDKLIKEDIGRSKMLLCMTLLRLIMNILTAPLLSGRQMSCFICQSGIGNGDVPGFTCQSSQLSWPYQNEQHASLHGACKGQVTIAFSFPWKNSLVASQLRAYLN